MQYFPFLNFVCIHLMTIHEIQDWDFTIATRNTLKYASVICTAQMQISPLLNANFTN